MFQLFDVVVETEDISDEQQARICKCLAKVDKVTNCFYTASSYFLILALVTEIEMLFMMIDDFLVEQSRLQSMFYFEQFWKTITRRIILEIHLSYLESFCFSSMRQLMISCSTFSLLSGNIFCSIMHNSYIFAWWLQCLVDGADEYLQLLDVASNVIRAVCNMPEEFQYDC